jgi:hypothetical protein
MYVQAICAATDVAARQNLIFARACFKVGDIDLCKYRVCGLQNRFRGSEHVLQILVFVFIAVNHVAVIMLTRFSGYD